MKKNISQRDIAQMLDVNVSTVSRALKGLPGVSSELRQEIMRLAEKNGYRPNPFAMSLRYDTTHTIGVIVPDLSFSHFAHIVKTIELEAKKAGYMCIITDSGETFNGEVACVELLENLRVEGIIMGLSQETSDFSHLKRLKEMHVPTVLFDRTADIDFSSVSINDVTTARQMTLHLIDGGARRIAFLGGANQMKQTSDRKHGYLEALRERGIPIRRELVKCNYASFNSGLTDTFDLLKLPEPPDAILAAHGLLAGSAFQAVLSQGLRIPEDVSICGYMSDWVSNMFHPRVTFVKQNLKEIGRKAFKLLHDQMKGDDSVRHLIVNAHLESRESTRNPL
jgi:LacI family transcriptional regulator